MFTRPYSIYIDKRPMRIAFLVNPESTSLEEIDQIIDYNRSLWGGRFNPIILTDGHDIAPKWWQFLRDIDPDVIKPLVPLDIKLIEKFEDFLSPLAIEQFREDPQSTLSTQIDTSCAPAGINFNSLNSFMLETWYQGLWHEDPMLGIFNLEEMSDDIGKCFILRNFGTYKPSVISYQENFVIPRTLESTIRAGKVPQEVREAFKNAGIPFSEEAFIKEPKKQPDTWVIIDREYRQIHYISRASYGLIVLPDTQSFNGPLNGINKRVFLVIDRESLADTLLELAQSRDVVFYDQVCTLPNTERDVSSTANDHFNVIIGNTVQDIVYSWNCPWLVGRWKRGGMNHIWLPTELVYDPNMQEALCAWFRKVTFLHSDNPRKLRFVSYSTEERELHDIAGRFSENLQVSTLVERFQESQIPSFLKEEPLHVHVARMDVHSARSDKEAITLTEPRGLAPHDVNGNWMADFYIEFSYDRYRNYEDVIEWMDGTSKYWKFPNRNHLTHYMFDNPISRMKQNGIPSVRMRTGDRMLRLTLEDAGSIVAALFSRSNKPIYEYDPRTQLTARPYDSTEPSDKGKYLQGVIELFGSLTFAYEILRNPYWRVMFDSLSRNTRAEQNTHTSIANKVKKLTGELNLSVDNSIAIESLSTLLVNESKKLDLKQKEFPFDEFLDEAERWQTKYFESSKSAKDQSNKGIMVSGFESEVVKNKLAQLTQRNIIQIGVKPRCPTCGMEHWYHVDDIGQHLTCQGCRNRFPIHPELTWHYRLNSLIHAAHALHGTTPVILVLGQLLRESRMSFLFSPNLNLLSSPRGNPFDRLEKVAEVDIACIQDGKFIIGEVKQSRGLFRAKDFDTMANIAKRTKPNKVLFSCIDLQQPTRFISKHIKRIETELNPLGIEVTWYELKYLDYSDGV